MLLSKYFFCAALCVVATAVRTRASACPAYFVLSMSLVALVMSGMVLPWAIPSLIWVLKLCCRSADCLGLHKARCDTTQ